jgi:hypothetical protein
MSISRRFSALRGSSNAILRVRDIVLFREPVLPSYLCKAVRPNSLDAHISLPAAAATYLIGDRIAEIPGRFCVIIKGGFL